MLKTTGKKTEKEESIGATGIGLVSKSLAFRNVLLQPYQNWYTPVKMLWKIFFSLPIFIVSTNDHCTKNEVFH